MNSKYGCIIFDVDGTMINTEKAVHKSYQRVIFEEFNRYFTPEEFSVAYGVPTLEALKKLGIKDVEEANRKYHMYLMEEFKKVQPYDGIIDVLVELNKLNIPLGIVTSRNNEEVLDDACLQGIIKYFKYIICADDTKKHKPDSEPLLKLM